MNPAGGKLPSTPRLSEYATNALEKIRKELRMFANGDAQGAAGSIGPQVPPHKNQMDLNLLITHLMSLGYSEEQAIGALKLNGRTELVLDYLNKQALLNQSKSKETNGHVPKAQPPPPPLAPKLYRKHSIEREVPQYQRGSPALDSGAGSSRSDSPHSHQQYVSARANSGQYSPSPCSSALSDAPPLPLPRCSSTPSTPPPVPANLQQMLKRISPATPPTRPVTLPSQSPVRGTSPVSNVNHRPVVPQNGPQAQQQLSQQMQALSLFQSSGEPPPPYPIIPSGVPTNYSASMQNRQSPTQSNSDYRKSPSSGIYSGTSAGSPSPITVPPNSMSPHPVMQRSTNVSQLGSWQRKTHSPIIMQSVKSTQVQKPVLQTAIAPQAPATTPTVCVSPAHATSALPSYASSIQQKSQQHQQQQPQVPPLITGNNSINHSKSQNSITPPTTPPVLSPPSIPLTNGTVNAISSGIPAFEPPSYASTMAFKAAQQHQQQQQHSQQHQQHQTQQQQPQPSRQPPPPPYTTNNRTSASNLNNNNNHIDSPMYTSPESMNNNLPATPPLPPTSSSSVKNKNNVNVSTNASAKPATKTSTSTKAPSEKGPNCEKIKHESPIPERKQVSKDLEEVKECRIRHYSPQAFKFYMEQHIENVIKSYKQRTFRKNQLEKEMGRINLSEEAQVQMRKMLSQKESNYIRLKRAKMDKAMFTRIKTIGVGAFGEVSLVKKDDTSNYLYAMKTLKKVDVLKRNQVAHVKAERDILAEADNEWVVKLYYSFQDRDNLYFVMDYIPGGDLMSLLIKEGIFQEPLAKFYIAELTCAVESVHKMGFIHRDIKPDNILIDKDGHIKLTDFGLCTGFRWTHDSKYYQKIGEHARQDSMEPWEENGDGTKPTVLERRRQRDHQRCLAHSLVGTPNYIAPEVLERSGYTQLCDWWSVGVILYEMLVGQPPFLANNAAETQQKVIDWEKTLHIPPQAKLSREATDLILRLCSSSDKRLGKNADEVKAHDFFKGQNFGPDIRQQKAPHIPKIDFPTDTSNFDEVDPERIRNSDLDAFNSNTAISFHGFYGFTYRRFFTDDKTVAECNEDQNPVYV